ncbi:XAP5, circadian clock regulator-domain-containing protein [Sphaerosporella brunnea]|uniref:XAP5, circadian clock regulator-domain-containing protein n=1 Tax=Sphaerosporella brunnea TaxID=1250544 RepID=A0A5J5F0C2_9PEZI|nr:XAP5, circadian clock regulator-domain-containing protein [Sphaerosporella brunnea]
MSTTDSTPNASNPPSRTATPNRFTNHTDTLEDALKNQTVGLVNLADFKKRRTELAEQRDREAAEKFQSAGTSRGGSGTTSREGSTGPDQGLRKKRKPTVAKGKLSFGLDDEEETDEAKGGLEKEKSRSRSVSQGLSEDGEAKEEASEKRRKFNPKLKAPPPKALTKSTLLREAQEREMLRREFLQLQEKIKSEEITIPFVFYDGTNVAPPNGEGVTVKKGEAIWLFLERARRMSGRREWLRVSVDDLLLVRGEVIIPHHYEFYYFIANRTVGPNGLLFDYPSELDPANPSPKPESSSSETATGMKDDPTMTKVVDRRWYERNKHIFPASIWTEFDPSVDYKGMVRRDLGGNAFFFG